MAHKYSEVDLFNRSLSHTLRPIDFRAAMLASVNSSCIAQPSDTDDAPQTNKGVSDMEDSARGSNDDRENARSTDDCNASDAHDHAKALCTVPLRIRAGVMNQNLANMSSADQIYMLVRQNCDVISSMETTRKSSSGGNDRSNNKMK